MNIAHQPGSEPLTIPEQIPNPAVRPVEPPSPEPKPFPQEPAKVPEKVPADRVLMLLHTATAWWDVEHARMNALAGGPPTRTMLSC
jgi:hypothetical protein